jgi:predicted RNA-binding protein with PIN domain
MRRLVGELALHREQAGGEWTVVFDGPPRQEPAEQSSGLRVDYALRGRVNSADDRIVEIVAQATHRAEERDVLVYTSDRALRERLLMLGARVEGAGTLLKALRRQP